MQVNIQQAKTGLSQYIRMLETRELKQINIARRGKPIAKLVLINEKPVSNRIGWPMTRGCPKKRLNTSLIRTTAFTTARFPYGS